MKLYEVYNPITSTPFKCDETYMEVKPCKELAPYIKCFWGSKSPYIEGKIDNINQSVIIPDTCMDIIFNINYSDNMIYDSFCGIDEKAFVIQDIKEEKIVSTFAIRFYPWSTILFSEDSLKNTKNICVNLDYYFSKMKKEIKPLLFEVSNMNDRVRLVQNYLIKNIHLRRINPLVMNSIADIIEFKGNIEIGKLTKNLHISNRQLERIFADNIGITPKKLSSLIRYQYLWQDILYKSDFNVLDATFQYGYTDQSHLINDFKRYHTMTISQAKDFALHNVAFLQEKV